MSDQVSGLCGLALRHGNGLVELTNRSNFQIRGVTEKSLPGLLDGLSALDLLDPDMQTEVRRSILVTPFWTPGDATHRMADALAARLAELPELPPKFGFVVDLADTPCLTDASGDIYLECGEAGWIVRADGQDAGRGTHERAAVDDIIALSEWFAARWTQERRRMVSVLCHERLPEPWREATAWPNAKPAELLATWPHLAVPASGQLRAEDFAAMVQDSGAPAIRLTPWRVFLLETDARSGHIAPVQGEGTAPAL